MIDLAAKMSKKTGLPKQDCDALVKVICFEIMQSLVDDGFITIEGLGTLFRTHSEAKGTIILTPSRELVTKLNEPYKGERKDEIILE
jgi:nucleoid DNA-binding protein